VAIYPGGWHTQRYLARLTATGELDPFFSMAVGSHVVKRDRTAADGRIVVGDVYHGEPDREVRAARLRQRRQRGFDFDPGAGPNTTVLAVAAPRMATLLIGGQFTTVGARTALCRRA